MMRLFKMFRFQTPLEVATKELIEAEHALLKACTGVEWAEACVTYNETRVQRLRDYINEATRPIESTH